jgi:hypothetical protein
MSARSKKMSELPPRRFRRRRVCATALRSLRSTVELTAGCGLSPLAIANRSPTRLTAWRPANTASLLSSVACARGARLAWLQVEGVVNTHTTVICKREVLGDQPVRRILLAREVSTVKYLPGWLAGPLRAWFSQTFGIITFCGTLIALMMLSASAVADSHPWRHRMRYLLGVVVFATAIAATHAHTHTHILP